MRPGRRRPPTEAAATAHGCGCGNASFKKPSNELGLDIVVSHLPPQEEVEQIEHRASSSFISEDCVPKPLVSYRAASVDPTSATTTKTGPTVPAAPILAIF